MAPAKKSTAKSGTGNTTKKRRGSGSAATGKRNRKDSGPHLYTAKSTARRGKAPAKEDTFDRTLTMLILVVVSVLLFVSDLGMMGRVGDALRNVQFGIFGTVAYLFPVVMLLQCWYVLYGGGPGHYWSFLKLVSSMLLFAGICAMAGLLGGMGREAGYAWKQFYVDGVRGFNGGILGGVIYLNLMKAIDVAGAYLVIAAVILINFLYITGMEIFTPLASGLQYRKDTRQDRKDYERVMKQNRRERKRLELEARDRERRVQAQQWTRQLEREMAVEGEDRRAAIHPDSLVLVDMKTDVDTAAVPEQEAPELNPSFNKKQQARRRVNAEQIHEAAAVKEKKESAEQPRPSGKLRADRISRRELGELEAIEHGDARDMDPDLERIQKLVISGITGGQEKEAPEIRIPGEFLPKRKHGDVTVRVEAQEPEEITREEFEDDIFETPGEDREVREVRHPAEADFSEEESMAAYDDMDSPDPNSVLRQQASGGGTSSAWKSESVWEKSGNTSNNAGRTFSKAPAAKKAEPEGAAVQELFKVETPVVKKEYEFPPMSLLNDVERQGGTSEADLRRTALNLETILDNFGVKARSTGVSCGPAVTRYELEPAQGVKVRRIVDLADDLKLNLRATDIRIEAPIPGKAAVGIEVPNEKKQMVGLKEMLGADKFRNAPSKVSFAVGKDIGGEVVVADLAKMPHLLIAGATGSGKSVCINSLIVSILYKAHPDDVKLIMIDPKVVELSVYNGIPHLMIPVVTDPKKAAGALNWAVTEMTARYKKFADTGCRDIKNYNKKAEESEDPNMTKMPQIVVIVDELADLMMVAANEVEEAICRLAQLARAAGIHLVLATQRPSVNVITGLIKANVPSRIAFAVSSGVDSRTIIDMNGAEKLLGNGDMLFYPSGYPKPVRIQGAFVSDSEVADIVQFLKAQTEEDPAAGEKMQQMIESASLGGSGSDLERDELFEKAGYFIIDKDKASIGNLQRAFRIGFNRAARIMDQLCDYGVVGPEEGTKARQVLMTREQFDELLSSL